MNATDCAFLPLAGQGSLLWSTAALLSEAATRHTRLLKRKLVTTNNSVPQAHPSHVKSTETTLSGHGAPGQCSFRGTRWGREEAGFVKHLVQRGLQTHGQEGALCQRRESCWGRSHVPGGTALALAQGHKRERSIAYLSADAGQPRTLGQGPVVVKGPGAKEVTNPAELQAMEAGSKHCLGDSGSPTPGEASSYQ